jgi:hypothetical protein
LAQRRNSGCEEPREDIEESGRVLKTVEVGARRMKEQKNV